MLPPKINFGITLSKLATMAPSVVRLASAARTGIVYFFLKARPQRLGHGSSYTAKLDDFLYLYHGPHYLLRRAIKPLWGVWIAYFAVLFVLPFLANWINGTAVSLHDVQETKDVPGLGDLLRFLYSVFPQRPGIQHTFVSDWGLLIILAVVWPLHSVLMYAVFDLIPRMVHGWEQSGILVMNHDEFQRIVGRFNRVVNHPIYDLAVLALTLSYIYDIYSWHLSNSWWDNPANGWLSVAPFFWFCFIIVYQLQMYAYTGLYCVVLTWQVVTWNKNRLHPRLYDSDGANGLGSLGRLINLIWASNFLELIFYFLLLFTSFVPSDALVNATVLINYGFIFPCIGLVPVFFFHRKMRRYKTRLLHDTSAKVTYWHQRAITAVDQHNGLSTAIMENLRFWRESHSEVEKMHEYPVKLPLVGIGVLLFYALQIVGYFIEIWKTITGP